MDKNDNVPTFAFFNSNMNINSYTPLQNNQVLTAVVKENDIGLIVFDSLISTRSLVVFDLDLNENSTFALSLSELSSNEDDKIPIQLINSIFKVYGSNTLKRSKTNVNLYNYKEIDFEDLVTPSHLDSSTGIAVKQIKFSVFNH